MYKQRDYHQVIIEWIFYAPYWLKTPCIAFAICMASGLLKISKLYRCVCSLFIPFISRPLTLFTLRSSFCDWMSWQCFVEFSYSNSCCRHVSLMWNFLVNKPLFGGRYYYCTRSLNKWLFHSMKPLWYLSVSGGL